MNPLVAGGLCGIAAALPLLAIGLRGRRVGDHRHCRKCGYDLHGQPESSDRCPECGGDLKRPRSTVVGQRLRRRGLVWIGAIVLVLALVPGTIGVIAVKKNTDWYQYKPVSWLIRDAFASPSDPKAYNELQRRLITKKLQGSSLNAMLDRILDVQGDQDHPWNVAWGALFEQVSPIDEPRMRRYIQQSTRPQIRSRSVINHDMPLGVHFAVTPYRGSRVVLCGVTTELSNLRIDGKSVMKGKQPSLVRHGYVIGSSNALRLPLGVGSDWGPGKHVIEIDAESIWEGRWRSVGNPAPLAEEKTTLRREFTVLPPGQEKSITVAADQRTRDLMRQIFHPTIQANDGALFVGVAGRMCPVKFIYRYTITVNGQTYEGLPRNSQDALTVGGSERFGVPGAAQLETVDVTIIADLPRLALEPDDTPGWGEDIVYKDVKVSPVRPTTRASPGMRIPATQPVR